MSVIGIEGMDAWEARFHQFLLAQETADPGHGIAHVRRVVANAKRLGAELNQAGKPVDMGVVIPAAWLHDCVFVAKNSPERKLASRLAAECAAEYLHEQQYHEHLIPAVSHAILTHSFSANIPPDTVEAKVVQDADRLEALGAIGIARCLMTGVSMESALYHPDDPFPHGQSRPLDDNAYMIDHFYAKLLLLTETMQTESGRREAERRTTFMHDFLHQLKQEITN